MLAGADYIDDADQAPKLSNTVDVEPLTPTPT
jgi:hypothetical protein